MGENFYRLKNKAFKVCLLKSILSAIFFGLMPSGIWLILAKLELLPNDALYPILIGIGCGIVGGGLAFLLLFPRDVAFAKRLDLEFDLKERVRTSVAYRNEEGEMHRIQRENTERELAKIPSRSLSVRHIWVYILCAVLAVAILLVGIIMKDMRDVEKPEEVIPFEISEMQIAALEKLISEVSESDMEEPYRSTVADSLSVLLGELRLADTREEMLAALATSISDITVATYDSSSLTELLNAMWATENKVLKALALALDTSEFDDRNDDQSEGNNWGIFAEGYSAFAEVFEVVSSTPDEEGAELTDADKSAKLKWLLDDSGVKLGGALLASGIPEADTLRSLIEDMFLGGGDISTGISDMDSLVDGVGYAEALAAISGVTEKMTDPLFDAISTQKTNTNVGESALKKLASLFGVELPLFERPTLKESDSSDGSGNMNEESGLGGGIGEGAVFGSDDLVLDPLTGEYVTYGTLYARYNTLMIDKLGDDRYNYTPEQRRAIEKYFALLYSGLKKDE